MNLKEKTDELVNVLKDVTATNDHINQVANEYIDLMMASEDDVIEEYAMLRLTELFGFPRGKLAAMICGVLVERGFPTYVIINEFLDFYKKNIEIAVPIFEMCLLEQEKSNEEELEAYQILKNLQKEKGEELEEQFKAVQILEDYFPPAVAIFSYDFLSFETGKNNLSIVSKYENYSTACHWLSKLFEVVFEEPILVIDLQTKKGILGKISGIVNNFQFQILLMALPELNEKITVPEKFIEILKGRGPQKLEETITGKWNMYNWEYLSRPPQENSTSNYPTSKYWIWGEGIPTDISTFENYRVILLDEPSYIRGIGIQRTFKNLEAEIKVEKVLDETEVATWLEKIEG